MALLEVESLSKIFKIGGGLLSGAAKKVAAVKNVSIAIEHGETLGLVGESGCGKSTLGRCILRLHEPSSGKIILDGQNFLALRGADLKKARQKMQIIFQDPYASLNPRMSIYEILREPLDTHNIGDDASRKERIIELLEIVGLRRQVLNRYPHEFSGGQRQRVGIARALMLKPKLIVADEPVSALDVSVQAQVLNLIADLQREFGLSFLFIAHDLAVVQHVSQRVGVMYLGELVELAPVDELYRDPKHPYTQALLSAAPSTNPNAKSQRTILKGEVPSPLNPPTGCPFHTRCPNAMNICKNTPPEFKTLPTEKPTVTRKVACHLY